MWMRRRMADRAPADTRHKLAVVDLVKAAACIMIFLYHCNTILPGEWKFLTLFGQDLGNNLFFMVSGFTLAPSIDAATIKDFPAWYLKRLVRILPITAIAYVLAFARGYYSLHDPAVLFTIFIYPTLYWFITAILVYYIILFFGAKLLRKRVLFAISLLLALIFILLYGRQERVYVIGLFSMLAGYQLREAATGEHRMAGDTSGNRRKAMTGLIVCFAAFILGETTDIPYVSGILVLSGAAGTGASALLYGCFVNKSLTAWCGVHRGAYDFIGYVGEMALPLYLVQCFCAGYIGYWIGLNINFPLSFAVNFAVVWTAGTALYAIEKYIGRCYTVSLEKKQKEDDALCL